MAPYSLIVHRNYICANNALHKRTLTLLRVFDACEIILYVKRTNLFFSSNLGNGEVLIGFSKDFIIFTARIGIQQLEGCRY